MAGSGKTTLVQQMTAYMGAQKRNGYVINLDPAVHNLPYEPNIDIRDTVRAPLRDPLSPQPQIVPFASFVFLRLG